MPRRTNHHILETCSYDKGRSSCDGRSSGEDNEMMLIATGEDPGSCQKQLSPISRFKACR